MFRDRSDRGQIGEVEKAKELINLYANKGGFTKTPCNNKYINHIVYKLGDCSPLLVDSNKSKDTKRSARK